MASCTNADDYDGSCEGDEDSRSQPDSPLGSSSKHSSKHKLKAIVSSAKEPPDRKGVKGAVRKVNSGEDILTPMSNHCHSQDGTDSNVEEDDISNQEGSLSNASSAGKKDSKAAEPAEVNGSLCASDESASNSKHGDSLLAQKLSEQDESSADDDLAGDELLADDRDGSLQDGDLDEKDDNLADKLAEQDDSLQDDDTLGDKHSLDEDVDEEKLLEEEVSSATKDRVKKLLSKNENKNNQPDKNREDKVETDKMIVDGSELDKKDVGDSLTKKIETGETAMDKRLQSKEQNKDKDDSVSAEDKEAMKEAMKMEVRRSARQRILRDRQSEERARKESEASENEEVIENKVKRDYTKSPHKAPQVKGIIEKPHTIIVTETKSLAQVINNAVRKEMGGPQEGKPTLVIIETKSSPGEVSISTISKAVTSISNTITVSTGMSSRMPATTLTPISMSTMATLTPTSQISKYVSTSANSTMNTVALTPSIIEDGGMAVEVPSLVVPYLIEYPPSRTISEFLKMLPLDAKEIKELEEAKAASKKKALETAAAAAAAAVAASPSTSHGSSPSFTNPIGRPKAADRWGAYFESNLGKFFLDIGLNLTREWVQNDLVKSQKRKAEKEGRNVEQDKTLESLINSLAETKEKNEPFHHPMKKCGYCSFKTESMIVMKHHYSYPHQRHVVHRSMQVEYRCNFCTHHTNIMQDIKFHMEAEHNVVARLERPYCFHHCPLCEFEDNSKAKVTKHIFKCQKKFYAERNLAPPPEFDPPAKRPKVYPIIPPGMSYMSSGNKYSGTLASQLAASRAKITTIKPKDYRLPIAPSQTTTTTYRTMPTVSSNVTVSSSTTSGNLYYRSGSIMYPQPTVQRTAVGHTTVGHTAVGHTAVGHTAVGHTPVGHTTVSHTTVGQPPVFMPSNQPVMVNQMMTSSSQQYQTTSQIYQVVNSSGQLMPVVGGNFGQLNTQRFTVLPTATSNSTSLQGPTPVALVPNIAGAPPSRSVLLNSAPQRMQSPKPNISITPVTKPSSVPVRTRLPAPSTSVAKLGLQTASSFVVCEICDGYIKDLEQLRTHMQWIHKVKIHPKMIFNRPPLNCQKCQFRFFTDQGLERHLLGAHGLVTSSMQENANKGQDSGRCTICGKVFQWKLLAHMSKDHNMILKPAHLSYKCTVCAATFGMYKLFETHVYQAHSTVAKRVLDTPDDKKTKPAVVDSAKPVEVKPVSAPSSSVNTLECSMCGMPFARIGNYYRHWERMHLKPCKVKLCRIDQCVKCLSKFDGKTPWTATSDDEEAEEEEGGLGDSDIEEKSVDDTKSLVKREPEVVSSNLPKKETSSVKTVVTTEPEEEEDAMFDMDVETHDDTDDESAVVEDDEEEDTALDMEVESHDVEHPSPGSIHTDEDD